LPNPSFDAVFDWIIALREAFKIPHTLQAAGIDDQQFDRLAAMACVDPTAAGNPLALSESACRTLYEASFTGRL